MIVMSGNTIRSMYIVEYVNAAIQMEVFQTHSVDAFSGIKTYTSYEIIL